MIVVCINDNWDLRDATLVDRHPHIPRKGEQYTVDRFSAYDGTDPRVRRHMGAVYLREIPGPPFESAAFVPVQP